MRQPPPSSRQPTTWPARCRSWRTPKPVGQSNCSWRCDCSCRLKPSASPSKRPPRPRRPGELPTLAKPSDCSSPCAHSGPSRSPASCSSRTSSCGLDRNSQRRRPGSRRSLRASARSAMPACTSRELTRSCLPSCSCRPSSCCSPSSVFRRRRGTCNAQPSAWRCQRRRACNRCSCSCGAAIAGIGAPSMRTSRRSESVVTATGAKSRRVSHRLSSPLPSRRRTPPAASSGDQA
ncbi:Uncharacterised protein [Stenotrophomonas maltophilia]|nr:Uncharacterised protein [Stenotrophomonas maltophilia]